MKKNIFLAIVSIIVFSRNAKAANKGIVEGVAASNNAIFIDTTTPSVNIGTKSTAAGYELNVSSAMQSLGVTNGTNASTGYLGEISSGTGNSANLPASAAFNSISTITLTSGVWFVYADGQLDTGGTISQEGFCISNTANNCDTAAANNIARGTMLTGNTINMPVGPRLYNITSSQPVYLTGTVTYSVAGASFDQNSFIMAVRIR